MSKLRKFIKEYYDLCGSEVFSNFTDDGRVICATSDTTNLIWNHVFIYNLRGISNNNYAVLKDLIKKMKKSFISKNKDLAIYFDKKYINCELLNFLSENNFERFDNEAWVKFEKVKIFNTADIQCEKITVNSTSMFKEFKTALLKCFDKEYEIIVNNYKNKNNKNKKIVNLLFKNNKDIVGVASVYYNQDVAHLHNFAVVPEFRGRGFAKNMLKQIFDYVSQELKLSLILQCDSEYVEMFYTKLGGKTFYRRYGFVTKIKKD